MKLKEIIDKIGLETVVLSSPEKEIDGVYIGDLLSNVMARAEENNIWITIQGHQNVVAVAQLIGVAAVIVVEDFEIEDIAVKRAEEKGINILRSSMTAYDLISELIKLGI